jgi:NAD(P)-dependent dehydrogenase (short-subunit alcohol dehydrogenase family)
VTAAASQGRDGGLLGRPGTGVVVTGGASGIGRASALALAEVGRAVSIWDVAEDGAAKVAAECAERYGVTSHGLGVDVRDRAAVDAAATAAEEALAEAGGIGGFVHCAGIVRPDLTDEIGTDTWDDVLTVNLRAQVDIVRALLPALRAAMPGSAIVGIASIEALIAEGSIPSYVASKHGVLGLTRALAHRFGPEGIRVNCVCPGYVETPMLAGALSIEGYREKTEARVPMRRLAEPDDIARAVRFLLSDEASYISGIPLTVDGGVTAGGGQ